MKTLCMLFGLCLTPLSAEPDKPLIAVSTYPLQWVCVQLGGAEVQVTGWGLEAGLSPPDLQKAALVVVNGYGFEAWAEGVEAPNLFRSSEAVAAAYSEARKLDEETAALLPVETGGLLWLDPLHLRLQARAIAERLTPHIPREVLAERLRTLESSLDDLEKELRAHPRMQREAFLALHPALEGLSYGYGWIVRAPEQNGARTLLSANNPDFSSVYETYPARLAIAIGEPDPATAEALQEQYRIHSFAFDAGLQPVEKNADWPALMRRNFRILTSAFLP